jgi:hypothetical protein
MIERIKFEQENISKKFVEEVEKVSQGLLDCINKKQVIEEIDKANQPGNSSTMIQNVLKPFIENLGFQSEVKGLFQNAKNQLLRPDYFKILEHGNGIIIEVERGKVTINNMDLLDFWKCHLCQFADVLFLIVPRELRQNSTMTPRKEF